MYVVVDDAADVTTSVVKALDSVVGAPVVAGTFSNVMMMMETELVDWFDSGVVGGISGTTSAGVDSGSLTGPVVDDSTSTLVSSEGSVDVGASGWDVANNTSLPAYVNEVTPLTGSVSDDCATMVIDSVAEDPSDSVLVDGTTAPGDADVAGSVVGSVSDD